MYNRTNRVDGPRKIFRWTLYLIYIMVAKTRGVCPKFGHPGLTLLFTKFRFMQVKNCFATIVNGLSVLKLLELSNGDLLFS